MKRKLSKEIGATVLPLTPQEAEKTWQERVKEILKTVIAGVNELIKESYDDETGKAVVELSKILKLFESSGIPQLEVGNRGLLGILVKAYKAQGWQVQWQQTSSLSQSPYADYADRDNQAAYEFTLRK